MFCLQNEMGQFSTLFGQYQSYLHYVNFLTAVGLQQKSRTVEYAEAVALARRVVNTESMNVKRQVAAVLDGEKTAHSEVRDGFRIFLF